MDQATRNKIRMLGMGVRQQDLVRKYRRLWPSALNEVISGKRKTLWIRRILAKELGVSVEELLGRDGKTCRISGQERRARERASNLDIGLCLQKFLVSQSISLNESSVFPAISC